MDMTKLYVCFMLGRIEMCMLFKFAGKNMVEILACIVETHYNIKSILKVGQSLIICSVQ